MKIKSALTPKPKTPSEVDTPTPVFAMASVHSRSKMYRTSAMSNVHSAVHFAKTFYTLIVEP